MKNDIFSCTYSIPQNADKVSIFKAFKHFCLSMSIHYIESVDKRTYVYTKDDCHETKYRLYELDELLDVNFLRCSKAMIINIKKIRSVRAELNARLSAELLNGERLIISRGYVKDLKKKLGVI